jgi:alkylation response protein AidB-like acyl-CoA dehydrogenase
MDFDDTPEEAAFRTEVRAWLKASAEPKINARDSFRGRYPEAEAIRRAKEWQAKKAAAGYAAITWPKEMGGRGGTAIQQVIYNQEETNYVVPRGVFEIGLGMCIPTLATWGTKEQVARFTPPALRGEEIWCQLFSEPAAGSDLAGIRTRAERDGDHWVINGQKIWTSGAHYSDWGILVTRSDPTVPKHKGLTFFFLDMKSPGVEIRPIKQSSGDRNFNEVFFTDVRIPDAQRLGKPGEGWKVSLTTLMNERLAVGDSPGPDFEEVFELSREVELEDGPAVRNAAVREKLAEWYVQSQGLKYIRFRTMTALSKGQTPGPEASIGKVVNAKKLQDMAAFGMELMESAGTVMERDLLPFGKLFQHAYMFAPGMRIAGGTDEILRNVIAERVLGLPQDVRVDKEVAFKDLPTGAKG